MPKNHEKPLAAVIGAGVVGLTTALLLQCNGYGTFVRSDTLGIFAGKPDLYSFFSFSSFSLDVTVIAADFPKDPKSPDYASTKAGAHWRTMCDEDDHRSQGTPFFNMLGG